MLRLVTFGGLRLEDESGPVEGRAAQRMRLALLTLLATPPREALTRDKLVGYLWPERGQERARALLSSALYDIRQDLGDDVVRTTGDDVTVNPEVITSDAALFTEAIDAGDLARAVELYTGPFLDGVHISSSAEFEHWQTAEQQKYQWAFRDALATLARARAEAGDHRGAVDAWRRLAVEDPASTEVALGYMEALAAVGNRAKAIEFSKVHTTLLREDYGAEPDPRVTELVDRLKAEPKAAAPGPAPEPHERPQPQDTDTVEVPVPPEPAPAVVHPSDDMSRRSGPTPRRSGVAALLLLVVVVAVVATRLFDGGAARDEPINLAVLPFENLSAEDDDYFADGLTETILDALGGLPQFRVPARTSAFAFKGRQVPAPEVGAVLGVAFVLNGSVRTEEDSLRVSVTLANTGTGYEMWRDRYDRRLVSVFAVQDEIARAVVDTLLPQLADELPPRLVRVPASPEAQRAYWRARAAWYERTPESLQRALTHLRRATALDPTYALAYAGIADVYNLMGAYEYGMMRPDAAYPEALRAVTRALDLDPELAEGHAAQANILFNYDWDWDAAERAYRRAIDLNPGFAMAHHWYSILLRARGKDHRALQQIRRAREYDPISPTIMTSLGRHYYFRGEHDRAVEEFRSALEVDSTFVLAHLGLGLTLVQRGEPERALGHYDAAQRALGQATPVVAALQANALGAVGAMEGGRAVYQELQAAAERSYIPPHYLAVAAAGLGLHEEAVTWFEEALEERSGAINYLHLEPILDPLRDMPSFRRLLERAVEEGLPLDAGQVRSSVTARRGTSPAVPPALAGAPRRSG